MKRKLFALIFVLFLLSGLFCFKYYLNASEQSNLSNVLEEINSDSSEIKNNAIKQLKQIADSGNAIAQYRYAEVLINSNDKDDAIKYLQSSSQSGVLISTELLGLIYLDSENINQKVQGFNLLNDAATQGLSTSQLYLGMCFQDGECGFPENNYLAYYWLNLAIKNGEHSAKLFFEKAKKFKIDEEKLKQETHKISCEMSGSGC